MSRQNEILTFENIARDYAANGEQVILECWRVADASDLSGSITLVRENSNNILKG